jgi:hypothetical protein
VIDEREKSVGTARRIGKKGGVFLYNPSTVEHYL